MSKWSFIILFGALVPQVGCVQSVLGVLLAPESVVGGLANVGAETLSGLSIDQLGNAQSTAMEIDRLLREHPDASNADRLRNIQESIEKMSKKPTPEERIAAKEVNPRRLMDKKLPQRKSDNFAMKKPSSYEAPRRPIMRPDTQPTASSLKPDSAPVHAMSIMPVRLQ